MAQLILVALVATEAIQVSMLTFAVLSAAAAVVDSFLIPQIFGTSIGTGVSSSARLSAERKVNAKSAVEYSRSVYGRSIVAGNYVFIDSSDSDHILHTVLALTYFPIYYVEDILWNEASIRKSFLTKHCWSGFTDPNVTRDEKLTVYFVEDATNTFLVLQIPDTVKDIDDKHLFYFGDKEDSNSGDLYRRAIEIISDDNFSGIYSVYSDVYIDDSFTPPRYCINVLPTLYHNDRAIVNMGLVDGEFRIGTSTTVRSINVLGGSTVISLGEFDPSKTSRSIYNSLYSYMPENIRNKWNGVRLRNIPHSYSTYLADIDQFAGTPQNQIIAKGAKLYDPRLINSSSRTRPITQIEIDSQIGYNTVKIYFNTDYNFIAYLNNGNTAPLNTVVYPKGIEIYVEGIKTTSKYNIKGHFSVNSFLATTTGAWVRINVPEFYNITSAVPSSTFDVSNAVIQFTGWSDNWALCVRDYLTNPYYGLNADADEIDDDLIIDSAYYSDDLVQEIASIPVDDIKVVRPTSGTTYGILYAPGDVREYFPKYSYIITNKTNLDNEYSYATSNLWTGLSLGSDQALYEIIDVEYYKEVIVEDHDDNEDTGDITRRPRAIDSMLYNNWTQQPNEDTYGTYIKIRYKSGDSYTIADITNVALYNKRYTINGEFGTGETPISILETMVQAGAGAVAYTQGYYRVWAGKYTAPTYTIDDTYIAEGFSIVNATGRDNVFNSVKGTYINASANWSATDFEEYTNDEFLEEDDNQYIPKDFDFKFIINRYAAQRLAKIYLAQVRNGMLLELSCNYNALKIPLYDNVYVNLSLPGAEIFDNKIFKVVGWNVGASEESPIDLILREENSEVYEPWRLE